MSCSFDAVWYLWIGVLGVGEGASNGWIPEVEETLGPEHHAVRSRDTDLAGLDLDQGGPYVHAFFIFYFSRWNM